MKNRLQSVFQVFGPDLRIVVFIIIILFLGSNDSQGQFVKRVGFSLGNGFNNKRIEDVSGEDFKIKDNNLAWKVFAATNWKFIGLEGGFRDFGKIEQDYASGQGTSKSRGGDIFATGTFNLKLIELFGKAGALFSRTRTKFYDTGGSNVLDEKDRETAFGWGVGAGINLGILHIRAEYENFHISPGNLAMLSVGAGFNFNKSKQK